MASLECPRCTSGNVININLTVENEQELDFYSCHECDHRWWSAPDGTVVELPEVLQMAKRPKRGAS